MKYTLILRFNAHGVKSSKSIHEMEGSEIPKICPRGLWMLPYSMKFLNGNQTNQFPCFTFQHSLEKER